MTRAEFKHLIIGMFAGGACVMAGMLMVAGAVLK
jgi:hypothetical protein